MLFQPLFYDQSCFPRHWKQIFIKIVAMCRLEAGMSFQTFCISTIRISAIHLITGYNQFVINAFEFKGIHYN